MADRDTGLTIDQAEIVAVGRMSRSAFFSW